MPHRALPTFWTLVTALLIVGPHASAQQPAERTWPEEKCFRYAKAWEEALVRRGRNGLSADFIARHEAFIAGGCTARADVCPRSAEELAMANVMTIRAMNAGTASTFLPFACRSR